MHWNYVGIESYRKEIVSDSSVRSLHWRERKQPPGEHRQVDRPGLPYRHSQCIWRPRKASLRGRVGEARWPGVGSHPWRQRHTVPGEAGSDEDQMSSQGYVPLILSVTGTTASNAVFAGTFEQRNLTGWVAKFGITDGAVTDSATLQGQNNLAFKNGLIIRCASIYGDVTNRLLQRFGSQMFRWDIGFCDHTTPLPGTSSGTTRTRSSRTYRPSFVTLSGGEEYLSIFTDDTIGPWVAKEGLTGVEYQTELNCQTSHGYVLPHSCARWWLKWRSSVRGAFRQAWWAEFEDIHENYYTFAAQTLQHKCMNDVAT